MSLPREAVSTRFRVQLILGFIVGDSFFGILSSTCSYFAVLWYVVATTGNGMWLGIISAAHLIPKATGAVISGPAVNTIGSRPLVLGSRAISVGAIAVIFFLLESGSLSLPLLALLTFLTASAEGPSIVADTTRFPEFCRLARLRLERFNAIDKATVAISSLLGVIVAGWIVKHADYEMAFGLALVAGLIALVSLALGFPADNRVYTRRLGRMSGMALLREAAAHLAISPKLAPIVVGASVGGAAFAGMSKVLIPLIVEHSGRGPEDLAMIFIVYGLTAMAGSLVYGRLSRRLRVIATVSACLWVSAACAVLLAYVPTYGAALFSTGSVGFAHGVFKPIVVTRAQKYSPTHIRNGSLGILTGVGMFIALPMVLVVGAGESVFGVSAIMIGIAVILAATAFWLPLMARQMVSNRQHRSMAAKAILPMGTETTASGPGSAGWRHASFRGDNLAWADIRTPVSFPARFAISESLGFRLGFRALVEGPGADRSEASTQFLGRGCIGGMSRRGDIGIPSFPASGTPELHAAANLPGLSRERSDPDDIPAPGRRQDFMRQGMRGLFTVSV